MRKWVCAMAAAGSVALASSAGAAPVTYFVTNPLSDDSDPVRVAITLDAITGGDVQFWLDVAPNADFPNIGDLRGFFFNVADSALIGNLDVTGDDVTGSQQEEDAVNDLGNGANVNPAGSFDVGVAFGSPGIGGGDDIQSTTFVLSSALRDLTVADFLPGTFAADSLFAVRLTSTGLPDGPREGSSKMGCLAEDESVCGETPDDPGDPGNGVPEPTTLALLGAGLIGAGMARRRR